MPTFKIKKFRDPIHGYISIPSDYCDILLDTPIMQRLREIEQTGLRVLFPAARHDRFSHSLGVYHLGSMAFDWFKINVNSQFTINSDSWDKYRKTFLIACLLHDCAHAPFSHTLEFYYDYTRTKDVSKLDGYLLRLASNDKFSRDWSNISRELPAHEKASASVVLECFAGDLNKIFSVDSVLVARMILGCTHDVPANDEEIIENCLIHMLNGKSIDVDKLDYIMRDTWSSGISNISIDIHRLLSSLTIRPDKKYLAYKSSALSVLRNVVEGRNYLYTWAYSHHKVIYYQYLLQKSLEELAKLLFPDDTDRFFENIFSIYSFSNDTNKSKDVYMFLPTDYDCMYLIKKNIIRISEARELLSRQYSRKALWKTYAEFFHHFQDQGELPPERIEKLQRYAEETVLKIKTDKDKSNNTVVREVIPKICKIDEGEIYIMIDKDDYISYTNLFDRNDKDVRAFFYVYVPNELYPKKKNIISELNKIP